MYLPERECSIQRRNQKVIEEAPSVALNEDLRRKMGEQAVQLARRVGYFSAGTVEFLVDKHKQFYFLEMNTRLQVEHPITEYITGIDLVEQMIRVAAGQKLALRQSDIILKGWAFESRVYAEDPKLFLPSIGRLVKYQEPLEEGNTEVRCDSGIREGSEISIYYDPLICKLCTHGPNRETAMANMRKALDSYVIGGITHNIPILREVLSQQRFKDGRISTNYLPEEFPGGFDGHKLTLTEMQKLSSVAALIYIRQAKRSNPAWKQEPLYIQISGLKSRDLVVEQNDEVTFNVTIDGSKSQVRIDGEWQVSNPILRLRVDSEPLIVQYAGSQYLGKMTLCAWGTPYEVTLMTETEHKLAEYMPIRDTELSDKVITAPMAGQIVSISVKVGDLVRQGAEIAVIEAMKMQNVLRAVRPGKVVAIHTAAGKNVAAESALVELEYL